MSKEIDQCNLGTDETDDLERDKKIDRNSSSEPKTIQNI